MRLTKFVALPLVIGTALTAQTPAKPDSTSTAAARDSAATTLVREVFAYEGGGRDPFASLLRSGDVRPLMGDLKLIAIYYDGQYPGRSVAVLRDITTQKRYQVRPGDILGRLRVSQVRPRNVTFTVQEFGFEHQETLSLAKQEETP